MKRFNAPWEKLLWIVSAFTTVLMLGVSGILFWRLGWWFASLPLIFMGGAALFTVRGYVITSDAIFVQRLFWSTRVPLTGLRSARFDPDTVCGSIRTCGNGG